MSGNGSFSLRLDISLKSQEITQGVRHNVKKLVINISAWNLPKAFIGTVVGNRITTSS
jgi:hypothetical protein